MFYWRKSQPKKEVICTICSREKDQNQGFLPAHKRYLGEHIGLTEAVAVSERRPFFILSGMFGLVKADRDLPYYDKRLEWEQVEELAARVAQQIVWHRIKTIRYYSEPKDSWAPYTQVLRNACEQSQVGLILQALPISKPKAIDTLPQVVDATTST